MLKRARPTNAWDMAARLCLVISAVLITWAMIGAEWWSSSLGLNNPFSSHSLSSTGVNDVGKTLFDGYPVLALGIIALAVIGLNLSSAVLGPYAVIKNTRFLILVVLLGVAGVAATLVATQLDSPSPGLVSTNGWIAAIVGWFFYFGELAFAMPARGPQLEFEARPDSSDG